MSIINDDNKITKEYMSFKEIGDAVEGTYVNKRVVPNKLKAGQNQNVYELMKEDGSYIDVYGKPGIDIQMERITFGQIVGFKFTEKIAPKIPGHSATNVIQVYANPSTVNEDWLKQQKEQALIAETLGTGVTENEIDADAVIAGDNPSTEEAVDMDIMKEINNLAIEKLNGTTPEDIKTKVMESTGLAFIESNLPQILEALKALPEETK